MYRDEDSMIYSDLTLCAFYMTVLNFCVAYSWKSLPGLSSYSAILHIRINPGRGVRPNLGLFVVACSDYLEHYFHIQGIGQNLEPSRSLFGFDENLGFVLICFVSKKIQKN